MLALKSSGVHSNGFSLVRKVLEVSGTKLTDPAPWGAGGKSIGEVRAWGAGWNETPVCFFWGSILGGHQPPAPFLSKGLPVFHGSMCSLGV